MAKKIKLQGLKKRIADFVTANPGCLIDDILNELSPVLVTKERFEQNVQCSLNWLVAANVLHKKSYTHNIPLIWQLR